MIVFVIDRGCTLEITTGKTAMLGAFWDLAVLVRRAIVLYGGGVDAPQVTRTVATSPVIAPVPLVI